ncbi:MAG: ribosome-associated translation inhibitor RaiA [Saprospiraceae bacterium]|nr:ribosome-associated translation inhibitor RaiA [Saprospiraceae bacterium]
MMNLSVQSVHFHVDAKLISYIEKKLSRLDKMSSWIKDAEVHLKLQDTGGKVQEKITEIRLHVPGGFLVDRKSSRTFESAIDASLDTLRRQLVRHKEKIANSRRTRQPKTAAPAEE